MKGIDFKKILNIDFSSGYLKKLDDIKNLDDISPSIKIATLLGAPIVLFGLFSFSFIMPLTDNIYSTNKNIEQEDFKYRKNKRLSSDIKRKRIEYKELQKNLAVALNMLPKQSQIPDLLDNVSRAGLTTGLKFLKFQPMPEVQKSIHTEVPSNFVAHATFNQLMQFLDNTGKLPRIVDVKGLEITMPTDDSRILNIKGNILTYRFTETKNKKVKNIKKKH